MTQRLRLLNAPLEDLSLSTHIGRFTATCNSSLRGIQSLFWSLKVLPHMCAHTHIST